VYEGWIQNFPDWVDNEIYVYGNKHWLRSNTKGYGGKTHYTDSQNSVTTARIGRELYHLQFSLQAASPETFGYTLVPSAVDSCLGGKTVGAWNWQLLSSCEVWKAWSFVSTSSIPVHVVVLCYRCEFALPLNFKCHLEVCLNICTL
jgi:hypothetical protein